MIVVKLMFGDNLRNLDELEAVISWPIPFIPRIGELLLDVESLSHEIPSEYGNCMWEVWSVDYRRDGLYMPVIWLNDIEAQ